MGGGTMNIDLPMIQFCTSSSKLSSPSTSNLNFPVSANHTATLKQSSAASSCSCHGDSCKKLDSVDKTEDKRASGSLYNSVFGSVPSNSEVENAVAALQSFVHGISTSGPELKWLQPVLGSCDSRMLLSQGYGGRVYNALRMLQTDPSVKRLVVSLSSDKAIWDAIMNNELVQKLRESPYPAENGRNQSSDEEPNLATEVMRWILAIIKAKVTELIEKFQALIDEVFRPDKEKQAEETSDNLAEKVRSSLVLSVVILLIVVVARVHRAA